MIVCRCGRKIEYFVAIALEPDTPSNHGNRPLIISNGANFFCEEHAQKEIADWENHNKGRNYPYIIKRARVNVAAETKKLFIYRVRPQLYSQFRNWWLPKTDIHRAVDGTRKFKTI